MTRLQKNFEVENLRQRRSSADDQHPGTDGSSDLLWMLSQKADQQLIDRIMTEKASKNDVEIILKSTELIH